jgi:hypothetical protein
MAERSIVDVGKFLQKYGLRVGENPAFGGVGSGHSPTGYHPTGEAIDVTDWRADVAPAFPGGKPISWKQRTGELAWRAKQLGVFPEALGPGDKGHDTHVHLALPGKKFVTDQQLEWLATGRYKTPEGKLTDVMPGFQKPAPQASQQSPQAPPPQQPALADAPQSINILIDTGSKEDDEERITPQDQLKKFISETFKSRSQSSINPMSMAQSLVSMPTKNYFA